MHRFAHFVGAKFGESEDTEKANVYVEKVKEEDTFENDSNATSKVLKKLTSKYWIRGIAVVMCIIAVILIIFGYNSITDSSYKYAVNHYEYYENQMKETKSMANLYGGSGILGGGYASLASSWKDMLEEAQTKIIVSRVKAGVGFGLGFVLLICAVFLFVKKKKRDGYTDTEKISVI